MKKMSISDAHRVVLILLLVKKSETVTVCVGKAAVVNFTIPGKLTVPVTLVDDKNYPFKALCQAHPSQIPPCSINKDSRFVCERPGTFLCQTNTFLQFTIAQATMDYNQMEIALESEYGKDSKRLDIQECQDRTGIAKGTSATAPPVTPGASEKPVNSASRPTYSLMAAVSACVGMSLLIVMSKRMHTQKLANTVFMFQEKS
ncbi:uncharacterized protein [Lepisosteus oculatus]|uniref:uncharacterized protein n=1 Tax=Lepisosteus oculatus TaxID=7918 RepID=UPI0037182BB0